MNKISVIIPVYNVEPYIYDCLNSVGRQCVDADIECIVVDDCGSDRSMDIVNDFITNYTGKVDFVTYSHEKNRGLSAARNSGLNLATGNYITFLDSDDELTENALQTLLNAAVKLNCDIVVADYELKNTTRPYPPQNVPHHTVMQTQDALDSYCRNEWFMMVVSKLYKKDFLNNCNMRFLEGIIHEDELWSFQCAVRAKSIGFIKDKCYIYKIRENSITQSNNENTDKKNLRRYSEISYLNGIYEELKSHKVKTSIYILNFLRLRFYLIYQNYADYGFELYKNLRKSFPYSWFTYLKYDKSDKCARHFDFHLALPLKYGYKHYLKHLHKFPWQIHG